MSLYLKSALLMVPLAVVVALFAVMMEMVAAMRRSGTAGGLGALSGDLRVFVLWYVGLTLATWAVIFWQRRRARRQD